MKAYKTAIILTLIFFIPFGAAQIIKGSPDSFRAAFAVRQKSESDSSPEVKGTFNRADCAAQLSQASGYTVSEQVITALSDEALITLMQAVESGTLTPDVWHSATGYTFHALSAKAEQTVDGKWLIDKGNNGKDYFELGFTGDINFTEDGFVMPHAETKENGVLDCIDSTLQVEMQSADVMLVNNEFTYSDRGEPLYNKSYTFRARPQSVNYMNQLGVDIVSLANNHCYDYGEDAFDDTLSTLRNADIPYVGAGSNIAEASRPVCFLVNGYKVAYLAASRAEKIQFTPGATSDSRGIFDCYDSAALLRAIEQAKGENDYVIVYVHWGTEYSTELTDNQMRLAKQYIDAGASAVIGAHPHILQGMEYYNGAPIVYSLGNFWFNTRELDTGIVKLRFTQGNMTMQFVPGIQANSETHYVPSQASRRALYDWLEDASPNSGIRIDDNGFVTAA